MWKRADLKERGKIAFQRNYWRCVLVSFVLMLFTYGSSGSVRTTIGEDNDISYNSSHTEIYEDYEGILSGEQSGDHEGTIASWILGGIAAIILSGVVIVMVLLDVFVFQPLEIGGCRFFLENAYGTADAGKLLFAFKSGYYGKVVLTLFLRGLYIFLWTLLFIIPGIIKSYEYRMVPYLLADCPQMSRKDAFRISKEMMQGQKMDAFILDLSFIRWHLLSAVTCGLAEIFYVSPYVNATNAELFLALKGTYTYRSY